MKAREFTKKGSNEKFIDPELKRLMAAAKIHYPAYQDPETAIIKWLARAIMHSDTDDQRQDQQIDALQTRLQQLDQKLDQTSTTRE